MAKNTFCGHLGNLLYGMFCENKIRKLVALALAVICYKLIMARVDSNKLGSEINTTARIEYINTEKIYLLPDELTTSVDVHLKNKEKTKINADYLFFNIDLTRRDLHKKKVEIDGIPYTEVVVELKEGNLNYLPDNLQVMSIEPSKIIVHYEEMVRTSKPVKIETKGGLPSDYKYSLEKSEISAVVSGPASKVRQLGELKGVLDLSIFKSPVKNYVCDVKIEPPTVEGVKLVNETVRVEIDVVNTKEMSSRRYETIPLYILDRQHPNLMVKSADIPSTIDVNLRGSLVDFEKLKPEKIRAYIDLTPYQKPGKVEVEVKFLNVPDGLEETYISFDKVEVVLVNRAAPSQDLLPEEGVSKVESAAQSVSTNPLGNQVRVIEQPGGGSTPAINEKKDDDLLGIPPLEMKK